MKMASKLWTRICAAMALVGLLALVGCGSSTNPTDSPSSQGQGTASSAENAATEQEAPDSDSAASGQTAAPQADTATASLDEIDCMLIALGDAGRGVNDVMITEEEINIEGGKKIYTIEFYDDTLEYEYAIDMESGAIIAADAELRNGAQVGSTEDVYNTGEALRTVCEEAGVDLADITITESGFHTSGGTTIYTIEFETATMEYEYAIDTATGKIVAADSEPR